MPRAYCLVAALIFAQSSAAIADDLKSAREITKLLRAGNLTGAEEALEAGLKEYPNSAPIKRTLLAMYSGMMRTGKTNKGLKYLGQYTDYLFDSSQVAGFNTYATFQLQMLDRTNKSAQAEKRVQEWLTRAEKAKPAMKTAVNGIYAIRLASKGKGSEALALMAKEKSAAKERFAKKSTVASANALSDVLRTNCSVEITAKSKNVNSAIAEWVAHTTSQVNAHSGNVQVLNNYINAKITQTTRTMKDKPAKAEEYVAEIEATMAKVDATTPSLQSFKRMVSQRLGTYKRRIASSKKLLALVGKPQFPIGQADWVNVDKPLTMESLKGKVVLIDFWAVWCGPCVATFPHLREWHEKHSDDGLVIVGATRYYKRYGFDKGRLTPAQTPLTPSEEQKMLQSFVDHHKLHHAIAVIDKENKFHSNYGVQGIPQAVVIDRAGKIRMIRVGSGEENARELGELIKKCLAEKAPE